MTKITERRQKQREADGKNGEKAKTAESTERANGFSCCNAADVWTYPKNRRPLPETPDAESDRGKSGRTYAAACLPPVSGGRADRVGTETGRGRTAHRSGYRRRTRQKPGAVPCTSRCGSPGK